MEDIPANNITEKLSSNTDETTTEKMVPGMSNIKYEWYQTNTHVIVVLLVKNVKPDNLKLEFTSNSFSAVLKTCEDQFKQLHVNLVYEIVPKQCTFRVSTPKVEIKLSKRYSEKWSTLERTEETKSSKPCSRNWDQVVEKELKDDKGESEEALNELFQKIYSDGSDEVKKAMNKSFVESGGTVLSTNWKDVARDTVNIQAPDGMEWKKWDT